MKFLILPTTWWWCNWLLRKQMIVFRSMALANTQMQRIWMKSISNWNLHLREHFDVNFCFNDWGGRCQQAKRLSWCLYEDDLTRFIHASIMIFQLPPQSLKQNLSLKCSLRCRLQFEVLFIQILCIWVFAIAILLNACCIIKSMVDLIYKNNKFDLLFWYRI